MINPPPGAWLTVTFDLQQPIQIEEALCVYPDGSLWYWSLAAAAADRRNRVGTFVAALDSSAQQRSRQVVADLLALKPLPAPATPSGTAVTITVLSNGRQQAHTYYQGSGIPGPLQSTHQLIQELLVEAENSPYSVLRVTTRADAFPPTAPTANGIFLFDNPGTQPVAFTLEANAFILSGTLRSGQTFGPQNLGRPVIGLTDSTGKSHGGIYSPARFAPGERAALSFLDAIQAGPAQIGTVSGKAEGVITLRYPGSEPAPLPEDRFMLNT